MLNDKVKVFDMEKGSKCVNISLERSLSFITVLLFSLRIKSWDIYYRSL